jgi:hypothetical protein
MTMLFYIEINQLIPMGLLCYLSTTQNVTFEVVDSIKIRDRRRKMYRAINSLNLVNDVTVTSNIHAAK